jgi:lipopolysaccharide biosynthesis protein
LGNAGLIRSLSSSLAVPSGGPAGRISLRDRLLAAPLAIPPTPVRIVAYYLPQFHPFPENDEWWGSGFTEWTNVATAASIFEGHDQPRIPSDLGFYDLRLDEVHEKQIDLAKSYGLSGFCYYYYWFSGTSLMTLPIDRHLNKGYDFDFCLCWANETWSRRWDGSEDDILIKQNHSFDSDSKFIHACLQYFRSDRYIKINGAPLLQVYRISLLERPRETIAHWRDVVRAAGFPDLHVCMVESFGLADPDEFGCDSSCQFPPHGVIAGEMNTVVDGLASGYTGSIYNYSEVVRNEIARPDVSHVRFRTAMPSWDNTARKGLAGNVFAGATCELFETWLCHLVADAGTRLPDGQRFVFVNAWNEWAEGAHLEPDQKKGHGNLRAVRNSLVPEALALAPLLSPIEKLDEPLAITRRLVESLMTSNRELTRIVSESQFGLRMDESAFVRVPPDCLSPSGERRLVVMPWLADSAR